MPEIQSQELTFRSEHEISSTGYVMPLNPQAAKFRSRTRPLVVIVLSVLTLIGWATGVFFYQVNDFTRLDPEAWWFGPRDFLNVPFLVDNTILSFQEQWVSLLGLIGLSFFPFFRRVLQDRAQLRDRQKLFLAFVVLLLVLSLQLFYLRSRDIEYSTFGVFLVVIAGVLGGARFGLSIGIVNMILLGLVYYYFNVVNSGSDVSFIRILLTELHLIGPIWGGLIAGYFAERIGARRFSWEFVLGVTVATEVVLLAATVISSWSPVYFVHLSLRHSLATPLMALGFCWLVTYQLSHNGGKLRMTQADLALAEAELKALRAQINPHFMVNSLSVIHHLVRTQPDLARDLLLDLSDLFQHSLRAGDFVPLRQELEHVRAYLALEQARLTKRLNVMWAVLAEDKLEVPVPTLILQPLIENAIVHGIAPKPEGGTVSILVKQVGETLHIQVADNGVGFNLESLHHNANRPSIGLKNVDDRLRLIYGEAYRLQIDSTVGAGTTMEFKIPLVHQVLATEASSELAVR